MGEQIVRGLLVAFDGTLNEGTDSGGLVLAHRSMVP